MEKKQVIEISVMPFTYKVITGFFGNNIEASEATVVGRGAEHSLLAILEFEFEDNGNSIVGRKSKIMPTIRVVLSERFFHLLKFKGIDARYALSRYFEKEAVLIMMIFITAQVKMGNSIVNAIDNFYNLYDIYEDDYGRDSAVKKFYRFNNK